MRYALFAPLLLLGSCGQTPTVETTKSVPRVDQSAIMGALDPESVAGTILVARGDTIVFERAVGLDDPEADSTHTLGRVWRWASVSKQITATIAMQEVAAGRLGLDTPISRYLPDSKAPFADRITPRMLMQHTSGLPRTEDSPLGADEWPSFYLTKPGTADTGRTWCEGPTDRAPPAEFHYGDCDFIVLAAVIERTSGKPYETLVRERIAQPLKLRSVGLASGTERFVTGYEAGKRESPLFRLGNFGAAGALYGTTHDLLSFDRALMTGKVLPADAREQMWTGDPKLGFAAFGQWVFSVPLRDCGNVPVKIVERRGAIGGVVLRNIILPDLDTVIIMTSNRAEADAAYGEIWQQKGVSHDVLRAVLCSSGRPE